MTSDELLRGCEEMAADIEREAEALEWCEAFLSDLPFDDAEEDWRY